MSYHFQPEPSRLFDAVLLTHYSSNQLSVRGQHDFKDSPSKATKNLLTQLYAATYDRHRVSMCPADAIHKASTKAWLTNRCRDFHNFLFREMLLEGFKSFILDSNVPGH